MRSRVMLGPCLGIGAVVVVALVSFTACGSESSRREFGEPGAPGSSGGAGSSGSLANDKPKGPCEGLECRQVECAGGATTSVSGVVTAPNGTLPLYNAIVFVPNAPLDPLADGASCDRCGSVSGKPLVSAVTDVDGKFLLKNVPVGKDVPLVVQVGKWRREIVLPDVRECLDNPIADKNVTRLPRSSAEGHIPKIAVTTGRCDQLACLLPKLGLDPSEYSASTGPGRLHLYRGAADPPSSPVPAPAPTGTTDAATFWNDLSALKKYDMLMLSCECGEHLETKPDAARRAVYDFAQAGGRVFASHFHYVWAQNGALAGAAQWMGNVSNPENPPGPYFVDTTFPKGAALAQWLVNVGATSTLGEIPISQPRENVGGVHAPTQRWIYRKRWAIPGVLPDPILPESAKYLNVNTPVGKPVDQQCGKFVFADMHLYGGDVQDPTTALPNDGFPGSCGKDLTPEEKALAFLFFDLAACVQDETKAPSAPIK
ncbi:MAG: carboxypeptidase regulatory-like domain-containing protein [Labilithrix sp.]|nr:carboxypeptidase regulatory-like domain-containing protein [Labilithrix sp.]